MEARLATHAEVPTTALPPCSSVADHLRLRSGERGGQTCYSCGGIYYRAASLLERC